MPRQHATSDGPFYRCIAWVDPGASLDAAALGGAIKGAGNIKIDAILAPAQRVLASAALDAAPIAEVA